MRRHFIEELELPTYFKMSKFHYLDVLTQMSKFVFEIDWRDMQKSGKISHYFHYTLGEEDSNPLNIDKEIEAIE